MGSQICGPLPQAIIYLLLVAPGIAISNKKLLVTKGIAIRSKKLLVGMASASTLVKSLLLEEGPLPEARTLSGRPSLLVTRSY